MRVDKTFENIMKAKDILTIYKPIGKRDKHISVKDYLITKIKELDRYNVSVNCHTVEPLPPNKHI